MSKGKPHCWRRRSTSRGTTHNSLATCRRCPKPTGGASARSQGGRSSGHAMSPTPSRRAAPLRGWWRRRTAAAVSSSIATAAICPPASSSRWGPSRRPRRWRCRTSTARCRTWTSPRCARRRRRPASTSAPGAPALPGPPTGVRGLTASPARWPPGGRRVPRGVRAPPRGTPPPASSPARPPPPRPRAPPRAPALPRGPRVAAVCPAQPPLACWVALLRAQAALDWPPARTSRQLEGSEAASGGAGQALQPLEPCMAVRAVRWRGACAGLLCIGSGI
mmetsp:Transcript_1505/g.4761  ORF Transcript_1505/g.4761 Transcript_1505/m.4761 type:complete len:277 (+) Transcript_1505:1176-2006(+)